MVEQKLRVKSFTITTFLRYWTLMAFTLRNQKKPAASFSTWMINEYSVWLNLCHVQHATMHVFSYRVEERKSSLCDFKILQ